MAFEMKDIEWIFGGIGVFVITMIYGLFRKTQKNESTITPPTVVVTQNNNSPVQNSANESSIMNFSIKRSKSEVGILFIDDDTRFRVVNILKTHGWTNTKIIKDINFLEQSEAMNADIFFVDIQGVGKAMQFKEEGLGLVIALKKLYPQKKLVIYSAESGLDAFHPAFKVADDRISKDADPYEFIEVVERLSK